ncbi:MAG TPA: FmdB family zinc ribbon protein [Vicinamibacterales bacterium]|nr:FmdB family zinc ribbon protein [Vicinamibacterales bacterium]
MPLYEYECEACRHRFERIQKFSDPPVEQCPNCEGRVRKLLSSPAIQFKGSGWYVTDYAKKSGGAESSGSKESGAEKKADGGDKAEKTSDSAAKPAPASSTSKSE